MEGASLPRSPSWVCLEPAQQTGEHGQGTHFDRSPLIWNIHCYVTFCQNFRSRGSVLPSGAKKGKCALKKTLPSRSGSRVW